MLIDIDLYAFWISEIFYTILKNLTVLIIWLSISAHDHNWHRQATKTCLYKHFGAENGVSDRGKYMKSYI